MKDIGKPCAGKLHARFDEGGQAQCLLSTLPLRLTGLSLKLAALCPTRIDLRLRTHLCKRHKVRDRKAGFIRFDNRTLYEKYGLYKVPTTAGWTREHAQR